MGKKLTTEEFIEKAKAVHGDKYDYSLVEYIGSKQKVTVICKIHNNFHLSPNTHLKGNGCKSCGVEVRASKQRGDKELFLKKARATHGDKYDYSKVDYFNSLTEVEILCQTHGSFLQTPKIHYVANCPKCGFENQVAKSRKTKEQFIKEAIEKYGGIYDYSLVEYVNGKTPISIICKDRGVFEVKPNSFLCKKKKSGKHKKPTKSSNKEIFIEEAKKVYGDKDDYTNTNIVSARDKIEITCTKHNCTFKKTIQTYLQGWGCPECSAENYSNIRKKSTEEFIEQAKKIHGDKCNYKTTIYKSCREKVKIKCNVHNTFFSILPNNHISGTRCKKCFSENMSELFKGKEGTCGYSKSGYVKQAGDRKAYVYIIKCLNENEEFYKIGKTFLELNKRFNKGNLPYFFKAVHLHYGDAGYIYDLENELHRTYKTHKYKPEKWFAGYTECFTTELPILEIINLVEPK